MKTNMDNDTENDKRSVGRPRVPDDEKRRKIGVSITREAENDAKKLARRLGISFSAFVEMAIRQELERSGRTFAKESVGSLKTFSAAPESIQPAIVQEDPPNVIPGPFWLDLCGGVAAGSQIPSDAANEPIPVAVDYGPGFYALRVFGQSMEPKIPDGSTIVVRAWDNSMGTPKKGKIVVYADGHGASLKTFGYRKAAPGEDADAFGNVAVLTSLNKAYRNVETIDGGRIEAIFVETIPTPTKP